MCAKQRRSDVGDSDVGGEGRRPRYIRHRPRTSRPGAGYRAEERAGLVAQADADDEAGQESVSVTFHEGRPDLRAVVGEVFERHGAKVAVLVCGPTGMGRAVRREVGEWVRSGREVFWHGEQFGW